MGKALDHLVKSKCKELEIELLDTGHINRTDIERINYILGSLSIYRGLSDPNFAEELKEAVEEILNGET